MSKNCNSTLCNLNYFKLALVTTVEVIVIVHYVI